MAEYYLGNEATDYALRTVLHIMSNGGVANRQEICEIMGTPPKSISTVINALTEADILEKRQGKHEEYQIKKDKDEITLYDVINVFEETARIKRCSEEDPHCSKKATAFCAVRRYYTKLQNQFERDLQKKLMDFVEV